MKFIKKNLCFSSRWQICTSGR